MWYPKFYIINQHSHLGLCIIWNNSNISFSCRFGFLTPTKYVQGDSSAILHKTVPLPLDDSMGTSFRAKRRIPAYIKSHITYYKLNMLFLCTQKILLSKVNYWQVVFFCIFCKIFWWYTILIFTTLQEYTLNFRSRIFIC